MLNKFNFIAPFYDFLARLVFGRELILAQTHFLNFVTANSRILILGGGTGWILSEIAKAAPNVSILYVEASSAMLEKAKSHVLPNTATVEFLHGTETDIPVDARFEVVITNCFMDLFSESELAVWIPSVNRMVIPGGRWLATDFIAGGKWWHRPMLSIMYAFFRIASQINSKRLPNWYDAMVHTGLEPEGTAVFFHGFIRSVVFRKK